MFFTAFDYFYRMMNNFFNKHEMYNIYQVFILPLLLPSFIVSNVTPCLFIEITGYKTNTERLENVIIYEETYPCL